MASPQRLSLERSMNQFRRELTDDQQKEISGANRKAIDYEIQKMQDKLGGEKGLCGLGRIERFLDAMEQIEKLVTIFLNVSEAVAFIWGPIKLVLMAATAWTGCVRKLLDVYEEIADALDNLAFFQSLIKSDARLSRVLEDYFSDILLFHHSILDFFSRPDWKGKFQWAWGDFRRKVKPTIESLKKKQELLSANNLQPHAILKEIQDSDLYAKDQFKQINSDLEGMIRSEQTRSQKLHEQEIKSFLERKLNISLREVASQLELPDTFLSSSGSWVFSDDDFRSWGSNTSPQGSVLFLTGCPGAGKSTLARTIIHHLNQKLSQQSSSRSSLSYYFFKHNDVDRRSTRSMLCHIITQIINRDDTMMKFAYDRCSSQDYLHLSDLKSLALDCLSSQRENIIILDGLDEGMDSEPELAVKWCLDELLGTLSSRGCHVRLLICGQEDGRIEPLLSSYPQIRLDTAKLHHKDIEEYCEARASVIGERFRLSLDDRRELILRVTKTSKGMFLYTKVVLANLTSMGSKKEFKAELASNRFPRNLDEAYERIIQRVVISAEPSAQSSAKKVLGWLVCSERPLRWREIQSRFCINADGGLSDPDDLRADSCKKLCSSLVDATDCELFPGVKSEQTMTMIHETASRYLVYTGTINVMAEHIAMSLFCCRYLSSSPFLATESNCTEDVVQSGYFSFMDYAAVYYRSHVQKAKASKGVMGSALDNKGVEEAFSNLEKAYHSNGQDRITEGGTSEDNIKGLDLAIQNKVLSIRSFIVTQRYSLSQNADFQDLEGPKRYKCSRLQCCKFSVGYTSNSALQRHLSSHERPFRCNHDTCFAHILGYASEQELQQHTRTFHFDDSGFDITFPTSSKTGKMDFINACQSGDLKKVKLLHLSGTDPLGPSYTLSPLWVAMDAGHGHICKYLIDNGANPFRSHSHIKPNGRSPIEIAILRKNMPMLELFLFGYQDLTTYVHGLAACVLDIFIQYPPAVDLLLRLLVTKPSARHSETVKSVMAKQLVSLFRVWGRKNQVFPGTMIDSPHSNDNTLLHEMFRGRFPKLYDQHGTFLINQNCEEYELCQQAFKTDTQLLRDAFLLKQYPLAAFLMDLDHENLLQAQDPSGEMPLHSFIVKSCKAPCNGCVVMAERLVKRDDGRCANVANREGKLPLHLAIEEQIPPDLLQTLLEFTEDLNHKDIVGNSPLHYIRSEEHLSVLLQHKDLNLLSRNQMGQTIFTVLCSDKERFKENMIRSLLDTDKRLAWTADDSTQRLTPLHYAMGLAGGNRFEAVLALLLQLPEVEQILQGFLVTGARGSVSLREIARERSLERALEAMDRIRFGLPPDH